MQTAKFPRIDFLGTGDFVQLAGDLAGMLGDIETPNTIDAGSTRKQMVGEIGVGTAQRRGRAHTCDPDLLVACRIPHYDFLISCTCLSDCLHSGASRPASSGGSSGSRPVNTTHTPGKPLPSSKALAASRILRAAFGTTADAEIGAMNLQGLANRAGDGMQRAMRDEMRRDTPGAFNGEALQGRRQGRSAQKSRRGHHAPIAETKRLQTGIVDSLVNCTKPGDRLFVGVFEEAGSERLAEDRTRLAPQFRKGFQADPDHRMGRNLTEIRPVSLERLVVE